MVLGRTTNTAESVHQARGLAKATAKLLWHGHADQVADLAKESIRDIGQIPGLPAPHDSL